MRKLLVMLHQIFAAFPIDVAHEVGVFFMVIIVTLCFVILLIAIAALVLALRFLFCLNKLSSRIEQITSTFEGKLQEISLDVKNPPLLLEAKSKKIASYRRRVHGMTIIESIIRILAQHGSAMSLKEIAEKRIEQGFALPGREIRSEIKLVNSTIFGEITRRKEKGLPEMFKRGKNSVELLGAETGKQEQI